MNVDVDPHHQIVFVTQITLGRPVEHERIQVGNLRPPISIDHDLLEAQVDPGSQDRLQPVGGQVFLGFEPARNIVDHIGGSRIPRPSTKRRVGPVRTGPQRPGDADQLESAVPRPQPQHIEGRRIVAKAQVVVRSGPPGHLVLAELHVEEGQRERQIGRPLVKIDPVFLQLGQFQPPLEHVISQQISPTPLLPGLLKADAKPDLIAEVTPHPAPEAVPEDLLGLLSPPPREQIGLLAEQQIDPRLPLPMGIAEERLRTPKTVDDRGRIRFYRLLLSEPGQFLPELLLQKA